jgi:nucleoid-associated protein YgaU
MTDPMDLILRPEVSATSALPPSSRYHGSETATIETADGVTVVHLRRRFLPLVGELTVRQEHRVAKGDRLDNLAAHYLGDPVLFWRIADANNAMRAEELTERPGRRLRIAFAEDTGGLLR